MGPCGRGGGAVGPFFAEATKATVPAPPFRSFEWGKGLVWERVLKRGVG